MVNLFKGRLPLVRICLIACTVSLLSIGIAAIYAVGHPSEPSPGPAGDMDQLKGYFTKQISFAVIGLMGFAAVNLISYRRWGALSLWIYAGVIILLVLLLVSKYVVPLPFAPAGRNQVYRWIVLHERLPQIQPSEFCKLAYILTLAWYLRYRSNYRTFKALVGPMALTLVPMALILPEPDLGTVVLLMPILFSMLFVAGAKPKHLVIMILLGCMVSPLFWSKMKGYQRSRISSVFLQSERVRAVVEAKPWLSELMVGEQFSTNKWMSNGGYQLIRSKLAIASGGLTGDGFRKGEFIKYNFLGERHTDFIYAAIAQQWGFVGGVVVLVLYILLMLCGLEIASNNTDPFGRLLAIGIVTMFAVEVFENISMTIGLMPITGLTLPLVSYGGSSLLVSLMAIGLLNNVGRSRPFTLAKKQ
jgi:rod shape determining protein RodA